MATHLKAGDKAPNFSALDQNGKKINLQSLKGKKIIYFYPEDDTPACTTEACNLRDNEALLQKKGFTIIGISPNTSESHQKFAGKFQLQFSLIPDTDHMIIDAYGVWGEKNLYGRKYMGLHRTTFVVDEKGIITKIFLRPKNNDHAAEILKFS